MRRIIEVGNYLQKESNMKRVVLAMLALFVFVAPPLLAQTSGGRLTGTVSSSAGVIPGATVTITDVATNRERTVTTNDEGVFVAPQLEFGTYTVRVTAEGFTAFVATEVKIDVAREYSLDVTLTPGVATDEITVVAGADILNSTDAQLSNTITSRQIQELPILSRDPLALIQLQAGVASNGATSTSINGQRPSFTNITRDGINVQDNFIRENASDFSPQRQTTDEISEFTVTTQNAGAEAGYGASQVQQVTPRGQSEFHGALFAYNRNSYFAANDFFSNESGVPRSQLNRNQYGGRIGGPLPLPRFGEGGRSLIRDKAFFFALYEGLREPSGSDRTRTILTPSARQGIFSYVDNSGVTRQVNLFSLPMTGPNAPTGIDPAIANLLARVPAQGNASGGDNLNTTGFRFNQAADTSRERFTTRLDFDLNERNTITGIYSYSTENNLRPDVNNAGFETTPLISDTSENNYFVTAWRSTLSPNLTNEVRFGLLLSDVTFPRSEAPPAFFITPTLISAPDNPFLFQGRLTENYNIQDNAEYTVGNHSLRFGGQAQFFRVLRLNEAGIVPTFTLGVNTNSAQIAPSAFTNAAIFPGGISTAQRTQANNLLALLGGIVTSATQTFNVTSRESGFVEGAGLNQDYAYENIGFYISDQWRIRPNFTLNLGLRYDIFTALRERNSVLLEPLIPEGQNIRQALLDLNGTTAFIGTEAGGSRLFNTDFNNFAPIISFAWTPNFGNNFLGSIFGDRTVIRGGYRWSFVNDEYLKAAADTVGTNPGLRAAGTLANLANARASNVPDIPPPPLLAPRTFAQNQALTANNFGAIFGINPDIQITRTEEFNIGIQREVGWNTAVEIRYVHGRSSNLWNTVDLNQIDIFNNGFLADFNRARSNLLTFGSAGCTAAQAAATGCQQLTVFPNLGSGGLLTNATVINQLQRGTPAQLALIYFQNKLAGTVPLVPNPNGGVIGLLDNNGRYRYNAGQIEVRRRFSQGLAFQANYTFSKTLADFSGLGQSRFEPRLDNNNPGLEYARADYDQTHRFNFNSIYELPFGRGRAFLSNANGFLERLVGGFQIGAIIELGSGAPITITDARGTLNRDVRSTRQTPTTTLSGREISNLFGVFRTPCGIFFIDPSVININLNTCSGPGTAAGGFGSATFPGQVFFNNAPGTTGNLERAIGTGPLFFNVNMSLIKNIRITENTRIQLQAQAFNVFNRVNFFADPTPDFTFFNGDINDPSFGRIVQTFSPRIMQFAIRFEF
jgi:hypothetical protein